MTCTFLQNQTVLSLLPSCHMAFAVVRSSQSCSFDKGYSCWSSSVRCFASLRACGWCWLTAAALGAITNLVYQSIQAQESWQTAVRLRTPVIVGWCIGYATHQVWFPCCAWLEISAPGVPVVAATPIGCAALAFLGRLRQHLSWC